MPKGISKLTGQSIFKGKKRPMSDAAKEKMKGRIPWNKGIKRTDIAKEKHPNWVKKPNCSICGIELKRTKFKTCSKHKGMSGDKNPNWKGGISSIKKVIRECFKYRQWHSDILTRDDYTCQFCFKRGGDIEVDHIKTFADILKENNISTLEEALKCEELWNINNGRILCKPCHQTTFKFYGNQNTNK